MEAVVISKTRAFVLGRAFELQDAREIRPCSLRLNGLRGPIQSPENDPTTLGLHLCPLTFSRSH